MALINSAIITDASGSIGGDTFGKNKAGLYIRARKKPTNPRTERQSSVRSNLASIARLWSSLTDAERASWSQYASEHPVPNKLGQPKLLSGFNWYAKVNAAYADAGIAPVTTVPVSRGIEGVPGMIISPITRAGSTVTADTTFNTFTTLVGEQAFVEVWYATTSQGISNPGTRFTYLNTYPLVGAPVGEELFIPGADVPINSKLWIKSRACVNGVMPFPYFTSSIAVLV